ncbi:MAG: hypothetical protein SH850_21950 [Planctomycetaceae bacterium]|nr:hypothetical protein [Planctomycetaceae bacterium]
MIFSPADHVRLAREAWESGHSLVMAAFAKLAKQHGVAVVAGALPPDSGKKLKAEYQTLIRHLRPLEPYLTDLPLVPDIHPWVCGTMAVDATQQYGHLSLPLNVDFLRESTEPDWRQVEADTNQHADEWRKRFADLERMLMPPLSKIEQEILEAIGDKTLIGKDVSEKAGYSETYTRETLTKMVTKGLLVKAAKGFGYHKPKPQP